VETSLYDRLHFFLSTLKFYPRALGAFLGMSVSNSSRENKNSHLVDSCPARISLLLSVLNPPGRASCNPRLKQTEAPRSPTGLPEGNSRAGQSKGASGLIARPFHQCFIFLITEGLISIAGNITRQPRAPASKREKEKWSFWQT
jgi:hypothetical protein